ncbi:hypothetical protein B0J12DRAFT_241776 [Macrophomina phaseolina]|uniref:Uncharacterized protein n=1 Tax=Macrophomina phaseolina TaxID=35725 RepID=A0ABQ8GTP8_9PEZI|nr:hypothetical protein B0J12DRAFT_241776 [Macrophomina phaseolina]
MRIAILGGGITDLTATFYASRCFLDATIALSERSRLGGIIGPVYTRVYDTPACDTSPRTLRANASRAIVTLDLVTPLPTCTLPSPPPAHPQLRPPPAAHPAALPFPLRQSPITRSLTPFPILPLSLSLTLAPRRHRPLLRLPPHSLLPRCPPLPPPLGSSPARPHRPVHPCVRKTPVGRAGGRCGEAERPGVHSETAGGRGESQVGGCGGQMLRGKRGEAGDEARWVRGMRDGVAKAVARELQMGEVSFYNSVGGMGTLVGALDGGEGEGGGEGGGLAISLCYGTPFVKSPSTHGFGWIIPRSVPSSLCPESVIGAVFDSDALTDQDDFPGTKTAVVLGGALWSGSSECPTSKTAVSMAQDVVKWWLGVVVEPIRALKTLHQNAIPQYTVGHGSRMAVARRTAA